MTSDQPVTDGQVPRDPRWYGGDHELHEGCDGGCGEDPHRAERRRTVGEREPDPRYEIRPARLGEARAVADLIELSSDLPAGDRELNRASVQLYLTGSIPVPVRMLVAEELATGKLVGVVSVGAALTFWAADLLATVPEPAARVWEKRVAEVTDVAVLPEHRRRGVGERLLDAAATWAADEAGFRLLLCFFPKDKPDAVSFHTGIWPGVLRDDEDLRFAEPGGQYYVIRPTSRQNVRCGMAPLYPGAVEFHPGPDGKPVIWGVWDGQPAWSPADQRDAEGRIQAVRAEREARKDDVAALVHDVLGGRVVAQFDGWAATQPGGTFSRGPAAGGAR